MPNPNPPTAASVWVVEAGCYSDYRVVGVYSTEEMAEQMAALHGNSDYVCVSEWPLNPGADHLNHGRVPWTIAMSATGAVRSLTHAQSPGLADQLYVGGNSVHGTVWATDKQHATKIANEYRIQARARGEL